MKSMKIDGINTNNSIQSSNMSQDARIQGYKTLIRLALRTVEGKPIPEGSLLKIKDHVGGFNNVYEAYAGILKTIRMVLRQPQGSVSVETMKKSLKDVPDECIDDLASFLHGPKRKACNEIASRNCFFSKLNRCDWRIDITISSSVLSRVLEPTILLELVLNNGKKETCEVTIAKFHELRYTIATILKEMANIEKKKMFRKPINSS